jgi:hypothetical protein
VSVKDDAIQILEAEKETLYDQIETIEGAIQWCIRNQARIVFYKDGSASVTLYEKEGTPSSFFGDSFLDAIDATKKYYAEKGIEPYVDSY